MSPSVTLLHSADATSNGLPLAALEAPGAWRAELNARLREHRERKGGNASSTESAPRAPGAGTPASHVAARVAERYSKAPSYQELLAASATAAAAAAESAMEAHAAAQAALAEWESVEPAALTAGVQTEESSVFDDPFFARDSRKSRYEPESLFDRKPPVETIGAPQQFWGSPHEQAPPSVEHHEPLPMRSMLPARAPVVERARALVDAFAEAVVPAAQGLPAKLIEFPRELIAPRKQRPRLAEGPLFEQEAQGAALRIFEVEAETDGSGNVLQADSMVYAESAPVAYETRNEFLDGDHSAMVRERTSRDEEDLPRRRGTFHFGNEAAKQPVERQRPERQQSGWGAIRLGEHPQAETASEPVQQEARRPEHGYSAETEPALHELAPIGDRMMAALVDAGIVFSCFLLSVLVFASCTVHPPSGKGALAIGLLILGVLGSFYGWLFMTHGGGSTPGMRYARIALCTFADENPARKDLQNRIPATALALLPLGLGLFWALLDEDKLGWHDRMTRTYQRSYRQFKG